MAAAKSAKYPYQWPNGTWHSVPWSQAPTNPLGKGLPASQAPGPPPPPPGTYDRAIDYNADAAKRGLGQLFNDAATRFEQGTQDRDTLLDRLTRDHTQRTADLGRQFSILGRQQAERQAQFGDLSQGLLSKSRTIRAENQGREQGLLDQARDRTREDVGRAYDREFAGYQPGQQIGAGFTPAPGAGSLLTSLARGWQENDAFQTLSAGQRTDQAAEFGYRTPTPTLRTAAQTRRRARSFMDRMRGA